MADGDARRFLTLRRLPDMPVVARYGLTLLFVGLSFAAAWTMRRDVANTPSALYLWFVPAIVVTAVLFDRGTSIAATMVAVVASMLGLAPPLGSLGVARSGDAVAILLLLAVGLFIAWVVERLRHAVDLLSTANATLTHASVEAAQQMRLFDAVLEGTDDPIYVKDVAHRFVHVNTASAQILGAPTTTVVVGKRDRDFLGAGAAEAIERNDAEVMARRIMLVAEEQVAAGDGGVRTFLSQKFPWLGSDGEVLGLIGISRDITERKQAETALKQADAQKQILLYDINHRIKNHLQSIVGLMSVASARARDLDEARAALIAAGRRLSVLGQVYNRLQIDDGQPVVDTRSFIEELCADLRDSLVDTRPIRFDVAAEPVPLESNRAVTLGLVINELVQNALKYAFADDRPGVVAVRLDSDDDWLTLVVADDGVGMDDTAVPTGTGLGARLITALTQQLGGTLSRSGPGTLWTIRFPRAAPGTLSL